MVIELLQNQPTIPLLLNTVKHVIMEFVFCSGGQHGAFILGDVPAIGALWFLWAMFWGKRFFGFIVENFSNLKILCIVCVAFSVVFSLLDNYLIYIPLSFNQGMSALVFMCVGYVIKIKKCDRHSLKMIALLIILFLINYPFGFVALDHSSFELYPLNVIGATSATILIYVLSKHMYGVVSKALSWCGYHSLLILCVHYFFLKTSLFYPPPRRV